MCVCVCVYVRNVCARVCESVFTATTGAPLCVKVEKYQTIHVRSAFCVAMCVDLCR